MKTVDLKKESPSVGRLLAMARKKSVLVVSKDGSAFVLEEADEFDREVAELGSSEKFMRFLRKRSKQKGVISIEQFAEEVSEKMHNKAMQPTRSAAKPRRGPSAHKKSSPQRG